MQHPTPKKAEKIAITLPPEMLENVKRQVASGQYGSTSEVIREALRGWQQRQEERQAQLEAIKYKLEASASSTESFSLYEAFQKMEAYHQQRLAAQDETDAAV